LRTLRIAIVRARVRTRVRATGRGPRHGRWGPDGLRVHHRHGRAAR
jgi:hypothetical protein